MGKLRKKPSYPLILSIILILELFGAFSGFLLKPNSDFNYQDNEVQFKKNDNSEDINPLNDSNDIPFAASTNKTLSNVQVDQYSILNKTIGHFHENGNFPGTYSFENDINGSVPNGWTDISEGSNYIQVIDEIGGHKKVLDMYDNSIYDDSLGYTDFDLQTTGTVEFWTQTTNASQRLGIWIHNPQEAKNSIHIVCGYGKIQTFWELPDKSRIWTTVLNNYAADKWYHHQITFNCISDPNLWDYYIDGVKVACDNRMWGEATGLTRLYFNSAYDSNIHNYIDAVGFSWDPYYNIGDNFYQYQNIDYPGTFSFDNDTVGSVPVNWIDQSNPGCSATIAAGVRGRSKVLDMYDNVPGASCVNACTNFDSQQSGTVEWWTYLPSNSPRLGVWIFEPLVANGVHIVMSATSGVVVAYTDPSTPHYVLNNFQGDRWYHHKVSFECVGNTFDYWIDGVLVGDDIQMWGVPIAGLTRFDLDSYSSADYSFHNYVDAVGFSWDDNYNVGDNFFHNGHYPATYSFERDVDGNRPSGWTLRTSYGDVSVVSEIIGHKKVMRAYDSGPSNEWVGIYNSFSDKTTGTVEFWAMQDSNNIGRGYIHISDGTGNNGMKVTFGRTGGIYLSDGTYDQYVYTYSANTWYHFKLTFDLSKSTYDYDIKSSSGSTLASGSWNYRDSPSVLNRLRVEGGTQETDYSLYIDAVGYSWDPDYAIRDNLFEKYPISFPLDFFVRANHTILDNSKILVSLSNFINPVGGNSLYIETNEGVSYDEINLPIISELTDITLEIPIHLNKLSFKNYSEGRVYHDDLFIYPPHKNFLLNDVSIYLEENLSQFVPLNYSYEQAYTGFSLDVSSWGKYKDTYNFTDIADGEIPTNWIEDGDSPGGVANITTYEDDHRKVLYIKREDSISDTNYSIKPPDEEQMSGTIEWWAKHKSGASVPIFLEGSDGYINVVNLSSTKVSWYEGNELRSIGGLRDDTWHHFKMSFDCVSHQFNLSVNGELLAENKAFQSIYPVANNFIRIYPNLIGTKAVEAYFDAFGYSWDHNYSTGDNLKDEGEYFGSIWKGKRVEIHLPKNDELKQFYGLDEDVYYDQLWSKKRIDVLYGDSYVLNLTNEFDHDNHTFYFEDLNLNEGDLITQCLNPTAYYVYFNKKPLNIISSILQPDSSLELKVVQTNATDYLDYSFYSKPYDPDPFSNGTDMPYFLDSIEYSPYVKYEIYNGTSYNRNGTIFDDGINSISFDVNLSSGEYNYRATLKNVLEPVYNTLFVYNDTTIDFYEKPYFNITPVFEESLSSYYDVDRNLYTAMPTVMSGNDNGLPFIVQLISPDGYIISGVGTDIDVEIEGAAWDSHDTFSKGLDVFENYSGTVYNFEKGYASSSELLEDNQSAYILLINLIYPNNSLIIAPEILVYNPDTQYSEQKIEIFIQFDLSEIIENYSLNPLKDFSFLNITAFGSVFLDSTQGGLGDLDGDLQIYNALLDQYEVLKDDYFFHQTLEQGNPDNLLSVDNLNDYVFSRENGSIAQYIDQQNKITLRILGSFEGNVLQPNNTYLSTFDNASAVLGALLDYVKFDLIWWSNSPEVKNWIKYDEILSTEIIDNFKYDFEYAQYPGTYNIYFNFDAEAFEHLLPANDNIEINLYRRPVEIIIDTPSQAYTTEEITLAATVVDEILGEGAIQAKVAFYTLHNGSQIQLGELFTDSGGVARLSLTHLSSGTHQIWAETIINNGRHCFPYEEGLFIDDKWALNSSETHTLQIYKSPTSLEVFSLAPEGTNVVVNKSFYIYPKLKDEFLGVEVRNEPINIYINSIFIGTFPSGNPFLYNFSEPGQFIVEGVYDGSALFDISQDSLIFNATRLRLDFAGKSLGPYVPTDTINFVIKALDLANNSPAYNLLVYLFSNMSDTHIAWGYTNSTGEVLLSAPLLSEWVSKNVIFYATNAPIPHLYLAHNTSKISIEVSRFETEILFNINETNMYIDEYYNFTIDLWNVNVEEIINNESLIFSVKYKDGGDVDGYVNVEIITSANNSAILNFSSDSVYEIWISYGGTESYQQCYATFEFEVFKRPTIISIDITDKDLVPENNFSITINLLDLLSMQLNLTESITVYENIYVNGTLVQTKDSFEIITQYTNTFMWIPYRAADFEFIFVFDELLIHPTYQNSSYSIILSVRQRQVWINSYINSTSFKVGDIILVNSTFLDINTTNLDPISGLIVHYLILNDTDTLFSESLTTDSQGNIYFEWLIPLYLINTTITILLISADTNTYQWNYIEYLISTSPLDTFLNVSFQPYPINYVNINTHFNVELYSIQGERIEEAVIDFEIRCDEISYIYTGTIDLEVTSQLDVVFSEVGTYIVKFNYSGSEIYAPTSIQLIYYIILRPSDLTLMEYPDFIHPEQPNFNLTYKLTDKLSGGPIGGSLVKLYYIDPANPTQKIFTGLQEVMDVDGIASFIIELPQPYDSNSIIYLAEANDTIFNNGSINSVEIIITPCPTSINFATLIETFQYYLGDTLQITLELYDFYENLVLEKPLLVEIETPSTYTAYNISSGGVIALNFDQIGLYKINVTYEGSDAYLPSFGEIIYSVSPVPTTLEFIEPIPEILYIGQFLYLKAQLTNNLTQAPLVGQEVKFYAFNGPSLYLIYSGITNENGIISYVWEIDTLFGGQNIHIYAEYVFVEFYENSSTPRTPVYISKHNIDITLIDFPDIVLPFAEIVFNVNAIRIHNGLPANECRIQISILYPNNTRELIIDDFTDSNGILIAGWTPSREMFDFNDIIIEIYYVGDNIYSGGILFSGAIPVKKLLTSLSITPEKTVALPGDAVNVEFKLYNEFNELLIGQLIYVEIHDLTYSANFVIEIGANDSYDFIVPSHGVFKIIARYGGSERNFASNGSAVITTEKYELEISLTLLEGFLKNKTCGFLGFRWNYSILDYHQNFTLIANVSIKDLGIPAEGIEVFFYFKKHFKDEILLGSNFTDSNGIAFFYWNTSNYSMPGWWCSSALYASTEETYRFKAAESDPIYFAVRKIITFISIKTYTSEWRIDVPYQINITLYDEFHLKLRGLPLTVNIYGPKNSLVQNFEIITNDTTSIVFTPTKLGRYKLTFIFEGDEQYHKSRKTITYKCVKKEPTSIIFVLPEKIIADVPCNITINLINSSGALILGETIKVSIMYHADSGETEYFYITIISGINSTFEWTFPESDEYVIKATFTGSKDYIGCKEFSYPSIFILLKTFHWWELIFFVFAPGITIFAAKDTKILRFNKKKKKIAAVTISFMIFGSTYVGIALVCSQIEADGLISDADGNSNYVPGDLFFGDQNQDTFNDLFDYGATTMQKVTSNIDPGMIPDLVNESAPYDEVIQNTTIIPPEADKTPPYMHFVNVRENMDVSGTFPVEVVALDRETGIQRVAFNLLHQGVTLVEQGEFAYNNLTDTYIYNLTTTNHYDGRYEIYAIGTDFNNNEKIISEDIGILNNPSYDFGDVELDYIMVELTDYVNVTFTSLADGCYNVLIKKGLINIYWTAGTVKKGELIIEEIPIDPLYFGAGDYRIFISVTMKNVLGFPKTQTEELNLKVVKESVKLELDIVEGSQIFSGGDITLRARLVENDWAISEEGEWSESQDVIPISAQVLMYEISDVENYRVLGTTLTDVDGYATFPYRVDLAKGLHTFNVTFQGNNIYQHLESLKLFENQGKYAFITLLNPTTPISIEYNDIGNITVKLYNDPEVIGDQTAYFNISNSENSYYLGMAMTDSDGVAIIEFPCAYSPGLYDVIAYYKGDGVYSNASHVFENSLEITEESTLLSIATIGNPIKCLYNNETEILAKFVEVDNELATSIGIEGISLDFTLLGTVKRHIGTATTDANGFASILFTPSDLEGLAPGTYLLKVNSTDSSYYEYDEATRPLEVVKDGPIFSIEGTDALFLEGFHINATLTDSLLNPLVGKSVSFAIINASSGKVLYPTPGGSNSTTTNGRGAATFVVPEGDFKYRGTFDVAVLYEGGDYESSAISYIRSALNVLPRETYLYVQGPEETLADEQAEVETLLTDNRGAPIPNQLVNLECYREDGITNLLDPDLSLPTNEQGIIAYALMVLLPGVYVLKARFKPQLDVNPFNDGFIDSEAEFAFEIVRIPADLVVKKVNLPRAFRGDVLEFTVASQNEEAQNWIIPVHLFVDLDVNGDGTAYDDVLRERRFIYHGEGTFSYEIPIGDLYQAGEYAFTIEIEEGFSIFEGSTSVSIDLVERTTLYIDYEILNPRAEGKHYIWEKEKINFTLLDEDGTPLPDILEEEAVSRLIYYQIINGRNVYGSVEVGLLDGKTVIDHLPVAYGFEACTVFYEGSRFFAPSQDRDKAMILRRPLILNFTDFRHNNLQRQDLPYSGHRGESIIVEATVQDYLNQSLVPNHKIFLGYDGQRTDKFSISNNNGCVSIEASLIDIGLIQAGSYPLSVNIFQSDKFESARAEHHDIYIFEIGYVNFSVGDVSTDGMNYILNPVIRFYDEDNHLLTSNLFYIEIINLNSQNIAFSGYITSGETSIPIYEGGKYQINAMTIDSNLAKVESLDELWDFVKHITNITWVVTTIWKVSVKIIDAFIQYIYIPIIAPMITNALWTSIFWGADAITVIILFVLHLLFGDRTQLDFTWGMFLKFVLIFLILDLIKATPAVLFYFAMFGSIGVWMTFLNSAFKEVGVTSNWIYDLLCIILPFNYLLACAEKLMKLVDKFGEDKLFDFNIKQKLSIVALEFIILMIYGFYLVFKGAIEKIFPDLINVIEGVFFAAWAIKNSLIPLLLKMDFIKAIVLGIIIIFVYIVVTCIVTPWVEIIIPIREGIFKSYYRALQVILITTISSIIIGIFIYAFKEFFAISSFLGSIILHFIGEVIGTIASTLLLILIADYLENLNIGQRY